MQSKMTTNPPTEPREIVQPRERDGKYASNNWEMLCICGHKLGDHLAEKPRACGTNGTGTFDCPCLDFKKARKQPYPPTESMKTKVEPTVEKWEREFYELYYEDKADYHIIVQFIEKLLSLSVQEAKAERDNWWVDRIQERKNRFNNSGQWEVLDDLLASLKQEEEV